MDPRKKIVLTDADMEEVKLLSEKPVVGWGDIVKHNQRLARRNGESRADRYKAYMGAVDEMLTSTDPAVVKERDKVQKQLVAMLKKDIAPGTVHNNSTLSNLSVQYANEAYIGDMLLPELQVAKETDTYFTYGQRDRVQYPDDSLGDRGQANEIQETRGTGTYTCIPRGFSNFVAQRTLNNQDAPLDEMIDLVEAINEGIAFRREVRQAALLVASANYGANTAAIAAANRWDTATGGDPIANIQTALAALWQGRGPGMLKAFCSLNVYNVLSRHPAILDLFKYGGTSPGLATPNMVAGFFGIEGGLLIGKARQDTAKEGQTASYSRIWTDVLGIVRVATRASRRNAVWGYTFQNGSKETALVFDPLKGHGGGFTAQVSVSYVPKVVAAPTGYLITTPIG